MLPLLLAAALGGPWTKDLRLSPRTDTLRVTGPRAPRGLVMIGPGAEVQLTVTGPGVLLVRAHAVTVKRMGEASGTLSIRVGDDDGREYAIKGNVVKAWRMVRHLLFNMTVRRTLAVNVPAGEQRIVLAATRHNTLGVAFAASFRPGEAAAAVAAAVESAEEPSIPDEASEPDAIVGWSDALAALPPPGLDFEPEPVDTSADEIAIPIPDDLPDPIQLQPGLRALAPGGSFAARAPGGELQLWRIGAQAPLVLEIDGPGNLRLELRAHKGGAGPEAPIVGVTLDEVVVRTLALALPEDPDVRSSDRSFELSSAAVVTVPIAAGTHRLQLAASEDATLGLSTTARLEPGEPAADIIVTAPTTPAIKTFGVGMSLSAGGYALGSFAAAGPLVWLDCSVALPLERAAIGLGIGYLSAARAYAYSDPRGGPGVVDASLSAVPVLLDLRYRAPLAGVAVEVGVGGGAVLGWAAAEITTQEPDAEIAVRLAGTAHLGLAAQLGAGEVVLRISGIAAPTFEAGGMRGVSATGGGLSAGYRIGTDG